MFLFPPKSGPFLNRTLFAFAIVANGFLLPPKSGPFLNCNFQEGDSNVVSVPS